jgi:hypothetical protein
MVSEVAILMAGESVKGLGFGDRAERENMVLHEGGVNEGVALSTSVNHCHCLNEFWAYSEFYRNNRATLMQLIFTKYRRTNKGILFRGSLSAT